MGNGRRGGGEEEERRKRGGGEKKEKNSLALTYLTVPKPRLIMIRSIQVSDCLTAETNSATRIKTFAVVEGEKNGRREERREEERKERREKDEGREGEGGGEGGRKEKRKGEEEISDCYCTQLHSQLTVLPQVN